MTAPPAGALDLPEPYALEIGARFDQSGSVLMELIVEPTSQEWRGGGRRPLYTAEQMREYALLAALRLREGCEGLLARIEREADAHTYFADNADLRMTTGDHAKRATKLTAIRDDLARVLEDGK